MVYKLLCLLVLTTLQGFAQKQYLRLQLLHSTQQHSFRGLSVPSDSIIWVSGTKGTVGKSTDGGKTFRFNTVLGYEKRDLRDIHAFDSANAIILAVDSPGVVLKTVDGGSSWKLIYKDTATGVFLDAMDFTIKRKGILVGDPLNGQSYILEIDFDTEKIKRIKRDLAFEEGEAFFAASGTNMQILKDENEFAFVTGGKYSRLFYKNQWVDLPIIQGKESTGANSLAVWDKNNMVIVGGDFSNDKDTTANCFYTVDGGKTWIRPIVPPQGYRSCVTYLAKDKLVACGTSGVSYSNDSGKTWSMVTSGSYHTVQKSKDDRAIYLVGTKGKIARAWLVQRMPHKLLK